MEQNIPEAGAEHEMLGPPYEAVEHERVSRERPPQSQHGAAPEPDIGERQRQQMPPLRVNGVIRQDIREKTGGTEDNGDRRGDDGQRDQIVLSSGRHDLFSTRAVRQGR